MKLYYLKTKRHVALNFSSLFSNIQQALVEYLCIIKKKQQQQHLITLLKKNGCSYFSVELSLFCAVYLIDFTKSVRK